MEIKTWPLPFYFPKAFFSILFAHTENVRGGGTKSHAARGYFYPDENFEWILLSDAVGGHEVFWEIQFNSVASVSGP